MMFARASQTRRGPGSLPSADGRPVRSPALIAPIVLPGQPVSPEGLLAVQQVAGNRAATAIVQRQPNGPVPGTEPGSSGTGTAPAGPGRPILRYGSTGEDVKQLQMKLRNVKERQHDRDVEGDARIDGIFGPLTQQDVIDFQGDTGLDADGIVGPKTWDALDSLVSGTLDQREETEATARFNAGRDLLDAGQYDSALAIFEALLATATTPESAGVAAGNAGMCHQQRGRFGLAVGRYEKALGGRFNQEAMRETLLSQLMMARRGEFLDSPRPDPEPLPPGADVATVAGLEGGGVTERQPAKSGDSGPSVDLYKGKLAHMMIFWKPSLPNGDTYDSETVEMTRNFQQACGLPQSGEADASTWHALDSFTRADVPYSVVGPLIDRARAAHQAGDSDPAASLPMWEAVRDEAGALGLVEIVKEVEADIGLAHHKLSHFPEAVAHYELYLPRNIPRPGAYGFILEQLRRAHQGLPTED